MVSLLDEKPVETIGLQRRAAQGVLLSVERAVVFYRAGGTRAGGNGARVAGIRPLRLRVGVSVIGSAVLDQQGDQRGSITVSLDRNCIVFDANVDPEGDAVMHFAA